MRWIALAIGCMIWIGPAWADSGGAAPANASDDSVAIPNAGNIPEASPVVNTSSRSYNYEVITVITSSADAELNTPDAWALPGHPTATPPGDDALVASNPDTTLGLLAPASDATWNASARSLALVRALYVPKPKGFRNGATLLPMIRFGILMFLFVLSVNILIVLFASPWKDLVDNYFIDWID